LALAAVHGEHAVRGQRPREAVERAARRLAGARRRRAHEVAELRLEDFLELAPRRADREPALLPEEIAHDLARERVGRDLVADDVERALERGARVGDAFLRRDERARELERLAALARVEQLLRERSEALLERRRAARLASLLERRVEVLERRERRRRFDLAAQLRVERAALLDGREDRRPPRVDRLLALGLARDLAERDLVE